jgi:hypothetical protein
MTIGTLNVSGVSLPIMDCKSWRVAGTSPLCLKNLDVTKCATCEQRETRDGNIMNPPLFLGPRLAPARAQLTTQMQPPAQGTVSPPRMRGLGDVVAAMTSVVGMKAGSCGPCARRRETLNRLVPFGQKETSPPPEGNGEGEAK